MVEPSRTDAAPATRALPVPRWSYVEWGLLLLLLLTLLGVVVSYQFRREQALHVGNAGDTAFIQGFNTDEADVNYRYRWSTARSQVTFLGAGSAAPAEVKIEAQGFRPGTSKPITMSVSINGLVLDPAEVTLSNQLQSYSFALPIPPPAKNRLTPPYTVSIDTPTFSPPGDTRNLGAKIATVTLRQEQDGLDLPPLGMIVWPAVLVGGLAYLLIGVPRRYGLLSRVIMSLAVVLPTLVMLLTWAFRLYTAAYLPPVAAVVSAAALLRWQWGTLSQWPTWVDRLGRLATARWFMFAAMALYAITALWVLPNVDWIGHADYAENAVIARNLVQGKGLTVDYVAQFYNAHPTLSHSAETWPLLQPLLIAPFLAVFGPATWIPKLPNLLVLLGLAWAVFALASRLWDSRVGLFAGLLTLLHPYFFNSVLYPINDLPFTAIFFGLAWLTWHIVAPQSDSPSDDATGDRLHLPPPERRVERRQRRVVQLAWLGTLAGLLLWSKPSGVVLLVGLALWAGWTWLRFYRRAGARVNWRGFVPLACGFVLVLLPLLVRNLLGFGSPFFSTEGYDAWILRYWPAHDWEDIYKVYTGGELPSFRWVLGGKFGYENLFTAVGRNLEWVWKKGVLGEQGSSDFVFGLVPMAGALVGLSSLTRRVAGLFGMVGLGLGLYALFVLAYWHFEGRYFQVAVPWLYMLLAWGVFWLWDRLRAVLREGLGRRWGLWLLPLALVGFLWPSIDAIALQIAADTQPTGFVADMAWLKAHTTPSDVIMTRDPWELNWYAGRKALMIPNDDLPAIQRTAKQYGATYLQLGGPVDGIDTRQCPSNPAAPQSAYPTGSRPQLGSLYCGVERPGYKLVYRQGGLTIYQLTP